MQYVNESPQKYRCTSMCVSNLDENADHLQLVISLLSSIASVNRRPHRSTTAFSVVGTRVCVCVHVCVCAFWALSAFGKGVF